MMRNVDNNSFSGSERVSVYITTKVGVLGTMVVVLVTHERLLISYALIRFRKFRSVGDTSWTRNI